MEEWVGGWELPDVSEEKRRTSPPQRLETEDARNVEDCAVTGVTAPEDGPGEES